MLMGTWSEQRDAIAKRKRRGVSLYIKLIVLGQRAYTMLDGAAPRPFVRDLTRLSK